MTATTRKKIHQGLDNVGFIGTENISGSKDCLRQIIRKSDKQTVTLQIIWHNRLLGIWHRRSSESPAETFDF